MYNLTESEFVERLQHELTALETEIADDITHALAQFRRRVVSEVAGTEDPDGSVPVK